MAVCLHRLRAVYLSQRGATEQVEAHMKAVLDDDATPFQHAFARHDVKQSLEALLKRHEFLHLEVARCQLNHETYGRDRDCDWSRRKTRAAEPKAQATAASGR